MATIANEVLVVGGGIIGCAIARELAGGGARVTLLERGRIGGESSSAAAGILSPQSDMEPSSPLMELGLRSLASYSDFVSAVHTETGLDPGFESAGTLLLNFTREDESASRRMLEGQRQAGLSVEPLAPGEIEGLESGLGEALLGGLYFANGAKVNPTLLTGGVAASARLRGAAIREGCPIAGLVEEGGRVRGVRLVDGERILAGEVVLAAGAWSSTFLPEMKTKVFPVRGQMLALQSSGQPRKHVLYTHREYLVPRSDGRVLVGSTCERAGFRREVTPKAVLKLLARALALDPRLESASFSEAWCGFRPGTTDGLPIMGRVRSGLSIATGHFRGGILLAPITAALMGDLVLRGKTPSALVPFSPERDPGPIPEKEA